MRNPRFILVTLLVALPTLANAQPAIPEQPEVLRVDKYTDDGSEGTLRWAIERNNEKPGHYRIEIQAVGEAPYVIKPASPLPPLLGPVVLEGSLWQRTGEYIAIDGSDYVKGDGALACPGANPGEFGTNVRTTTQPGLILRDTHSVHISGLEVRNFCIGILINRASNNLIRDNRIVANKGGAGIMLTGDDGQGNPTSTTTNNNKVLRNQLIDNGDGLELTRGAAFNLIADNLFLSTPLNPEPSQGIEILWGNDNTVVRNRFENYSDGLQINWGKRNYLGANEFTGNSIGLNLSGESNIANGNLIHGNRIGIALRPEAALTATRLSANRIWNNSRDIRRCEAGGSCVEGQRTGAIVFGVPALEHADFVGSRGKGDNPNPGKRHKICAPGAVVDDCQSMPNRNQQPPLLTGIETQEGRRQLAGELRGEPNGNYRLEVFGNRAASGSEAEEYLGELYVPTDAQGLARFTFPVTDPSLQSFTATATTPDGATSELSSALIVSQASRAGTVPTATVQQAESASALEPVRRIVLKSVVIGEGSPKTIVPTTAKTAATLLAQAERIGSNKDVDIAEFRIDYLDIALDGEALANLGPQVAKALNGKPMILTFRTKAEGGATAITDEAYGKLYSTLLKAGFADMLDLEMFRDERVVRQIVAEAHQAGVAVVMSNHDFEKTPATEEIIARLRRQQDLGADVLKIAVMPHDADDVLRLLDATWQMRSRYTDRPLLTMSMGGAGAVSRLSGEVFGQAMTFGMIGQASAPGQIDVTELRSVLGTLHESVKAR